MKVEKLMHTAFIDTAAATSVPAADIAEPVLTVENLKTYFRSPQGLARVVDDVSFSVQQGRTLAIVGESGSGKTMLSRSIMGLVPEPPGIRAGGRVMFDGKDLRALPERELRKLRGRAMSMVFQDPMTSLNPLMRIEDQIVEVLRWHLRMSRQDAQKRALELLQLVGVPSPERRLKEYPHQLSGGLRQRVMIAIGIACKPKLLLADEPTTALDVSIQEQILRLLKSYQRENSMAMIYISHDLGTVAGIADDIAVMYAGRIVEHGPARQVLNAPRMRYTQALLRSISRLDAPSHSRLEVIAGRPPALTDLPEGCAFAPRCKHAQAKCMNARPSLAGAGHAFACWYPADAKEATL